MTTSLTYVIWCGMKTPHKHHEWYCSGYMVRCRGIEDVANLPEVTRGVDFGESSEDKESS